ncbi:hypothetical protein FRAAL0479 [Frankia alni ACN14a]|uniref:Uncharacterized protein n=1 Tax=Frankia alni (strain DSM 45986 / CECT 9034 / ACN14a) TaxID=326424 RepID=Q0RTE5_FRAAA|nr:hypothetical protein FRAAL0479 [Frankia alni ACN14a]
MIFSLELRAAFPKLLAVRITAAAPPLRFNFHFLRKALRFQFLSLTIDLASTERTRNPWHHTANKTSPKYPESP